MAGLYVRASCFISGWERSGDEAKSSKRGRDRGSFGRSGLALEGTGSFGIITDTSHSLAGGHIKRSMAPNSLVADFSLCSEARALAFALSSVHILPQFFLCLAAALHSPHSPYIISSKKELPLPSAAPLYPQTWNVSTALTTMRSILHTDFCPLFPPLDYTPQETISVSHSLSTEHRFRCARIESQSILRECMLDLPL